MISSFIIEKEVGLMLKSVNKSQYLTVDTIVSISSSMVRNCERFALLRKPHEFLSIVMAFSHFLFCNLPEKGTNSVFTKFP